MKRIISSVPLNVQLLLVVLAAMAIAAVVGGDPWGP
jgi:hypothetical protein